MKPRQEANTNEDLRIEFFSVVVVVVVVAVVFACSANTQQAQPRLSAVIDFPHRHFSTNYHYLCCTVPSLLYFINPHQWFSLCVLSS
jgi:hypothetical protein